MNYVIIGSGSSLSAIGANPSPDYCRNSVDWSLRYKLKWNSIASRALNMPSSFGHPVCVAMYTTMADTTHRFFSQLLLDKICVVKGII